MEEHSGAIKDFPRTEEPAKKNTGEMRRWNPTCCVVTPVRVQAGCSLNILKEGAYYHITGITVATAPSLAWLRFSINRASFVFVRSPPGSLHVLTTSSGMKLFTGPDGPVGPGPRLKQEAESLLRLTMWRNG